MTESPAADPDPQTGGEETAPPRVADLVANVVEDRAEVRQAADVDWPSRAFVTAVEGDRDHGRATAERPRAGALVVAAVLCAVIVAGLAAWPALVATVQHASRTAAVATTRPQQARTATPEGPGGQVAEAPPGAGPVAGGGPASVSGPAPPGAAALLQSVDQRPAPQPPLSGQTPQQPAQPQQAAVQTTPPGSKVVSPSLGGQGWSSLGHGGYPSFNGPIWWTTNTAATATWTLTGVTSRSVTVQVWIPNTMAGALVDYTVNGAQGKQITQEWHNNWQTVGTFASSGTITVRMTYVSAGHIQATPDPACIGGTVCTAMAAAQVQFQWT